MKKEKPIIEQTLAEKADNRSRIETGRAAANVAGWMVHVGIAISAILTVIYLMLLTQAAVNLPTPFDWIFGLLVGVVAIVPAEMAMLIWLARIGNEAAITKAQQNVARAAVFLAGVFSALTTSSFFSYFLPQLFPAGYLAIAPTLNVAAIIGSWIVFIMSNVLWGMFSRQTRQNLSEAEAHQKIFDARFSVLKAAGEAIRIEADKMIHAMDEENVFEDDARQLILAALGMDENRITRPAIEQRRPTKPEPVEEIPITASQPVPNGNGSRNGHTFA